MNEAPAVLQDVAANLATGAGEGVQGVEVDVSGDEGDDAALVVRSGDPGGLLLGFWDSER